MLLSYRHLTSRDLFSCQNISLKLGLTLLLACITWCPLSNSAAKKFINPKALAQQSAQQFDSRSLDDNNLRKYIETALGHSIETWPIQQWDLSLLTLASLYFHPDLDLARAHWYTSQAAIHTAGGRPNLYLQIIPQYAPSAHSGAWLASISPGFVIETGNKRRHRIQQATRLSESAHFNILNSAWLVRSRLRTNWVNYLLLQKRESILQQQIKMETEISTLMQHRFDLGEASRIELLQSQSTLAQMLVNLSDIQRQLVLTRAQVANAIGIPVPMIDGIQFSDEPLENLPMLSDTTALDLRKIALHQRADLNAIIAEYEAAQSALQLEMSKRFPDIRLGPGYYWDQTLSYWSIASYFIFPSYYRSKAAIPEMTAKRDEVGVRFTALQTQIMGDVDRSWNTYHSALKRIDEANHLLGIQTAHQQEVGSQFQQGEADRITLLTAYIDQKTALLSQLDAISTSQQALGLLEDTLQQPLSFDSKKQFVNAVTEKQLEINPRLDERKE